MGKIRDKAREIAGEYENTGDVIDLAVQCSIYGFQYGNKSSSQRELFELALVEYLSEADKIRKMKFGCSCK